MINVTDSDWGKVLLFETMSRPFESFEFMNRGWDVRFLESQSLRSAFVMLLLDLFILGMLTGLTIYGVVRSHRFDWSAGMGSLVLLLSVFRYVPLIYRRLDR